MPHIHEKIDFTAEVLLVHNNTVLLRKHDKYKIWLAVGGHIELNEDPNQAAVREVKEEVGVDITLHSSRPIPKDSDNTHNLIPPEYINRHRINDTHEHVTFVYFAKVASNKLILSQDEKAEEVHWFTLEDLNNPAYDLKPNIRFYAKEALRVLGTTK